MKDTFSQMHPIVNFIFFLFVIVISMFMQNPVCLAISLICALVNAVYLNGIKAIKLSLVYLLPMVVLITIINPVFNHQGVTILAYFPWDNPLTLESIIYGISAAVLLSSVVLWFSCFNSVMTSDKFVYLFGRIIPALSLVLSMTLRFVPRFTTQFAKVRTAQKCVGKDFSEGSLMSRIKHAIKMVSVMISWSLENAIETADSMKSRGYGLKGRTAFSIFRFEKRDLITLIIITITATGTIAIFIGDFAEFRYFPTIKGELFNIYTVTEYVLYALLMLTPIIINVKEGLKWKKLKSVI